MKVTHLLYTPFTGLGMYGGYRGKRWLRNRIAVFKQFVIPSLQNQTDQDFVHWISWRPEERDNPLVRELYYYMKNTANYEFVFTYSGLCFYDDKLPHDVAMDKLIMNLHKTSHELVDILEDNVLMTIQPSDDLYRKDMVEFMKKTLLQTDYQAAGYTKGYIMNYGTKEVCEYNPKTNPPFFTIKFTKEVFINPSLHANYTGPYQSHEYVGKYLKYMQVDTRGFLVGTHGENISTHFSHPFKGVQVYGVLEDFGVATVPALTLPISLRKKMLRMLPHSWQRKLRYWFGERMYNVFYNWIRS